MLDLVNVNYMGVLGTLGFLAFLVNLLVQLIKDINPISKVPTKLVTIVVSIIVCLIECYIVNTSNYLLYILAAFPVAYISMFGYDNFLDLYKRFKK